MTNRRQFLRGVAAGFFGAAIVSRVQAASLPEAPTIGAAARATRETEGGLRNREQQPDDEREVAYLRNHLS